MSARLQLTFAGGDYDFVRPLMDGTVQVEGVDLNILTAMGSGERHWRMGHRREFDLCEFNIAAYLAARDRDDEFTALPVFLHRRFRHGFLFVNAQSAIYEPKQLVGKRVGGPTYTAAGNVWMRGILGDRYDLPYHQVSWVVEREDAVLHDNAKGVSIERLPHGSRAEDLLLKGELDALLHPDIPNSVLSGDGRIIRLLRDVRQQEQDYFRETGIFPIMHVTVVKRSLVERHPWIVVNLRKAFEEAKALAYERIRNPRNAALAWGRDCLDDQIAVLGRDPWEYGLTSKNRKTLETIRRYAWEQGIISKQLPLEDLFVDDAMIDIAHGI